MIDRLKERLTDPERWKQAVEEAWHTFIVLFFISFVGWAQGLKRLPNLEEAKASIYAFITAAAGAAGKALYWQLTGTKVNRAKKVRTERGYSLVEVLLAVFLIIIILVVLQRLL